ncbi:unnamed protein product [marine sediment metagenome]|uniref:Uncharacterized protein n=1 Tax=marine sediment metagenome TaxID=412755 RepID=X0X4V5_9ZZZZ
MGIFKRIKTFFFGREFSEVANETKRIKIKGVLFTIKKLDVLDYLEGQTVLTKVYDVADNKRKNLKLVDTSPSTSDCKAIKQHYTDVFMAGVVRPVLSKDGNGETISVDEIFKMGNLYESLYMAIIMFTHGKKKIQLDTF